MTAEVRTAKDLATRGYRVVGVGRHSNYASGTVSPPSYSLRRIKDDRQVALIEGLASERGRERARHRRHRREQASYYVVRGRTKRGEFRRLPMDGQFKTTVEAAHAFLDREEAAR